MHELLAHVLWTVSSDAIDLGQASKTLGEDATVKFMFDADHIEHDAFAIFGQVMQSSKGFYISEGPVSIAARSQHIFNELLPKVDPILAQHLTSLEIVPQVYIIRWVRLLFSREFELDEVLSLWDVIFAEDQTLEIVDLVSIAMLLRARWHLLDTDYNGALSILLRYPKQGPEFPPQSFVLDALYLQTHLDNDGANVLVSKYTGRPLVRSNRPGTPPALQRNITAFSGLTSPRTPHSSLSPPRTPRPGRNIEAILQNTAKNIYAQGEKLGIGKAVRNAVDEVHRKAQEIRDTQAPSPPPWRRSGNARLTDKLRELENRNRKLAALLSEAVNDLWDQQKLISDQDESENKESTSKTLEKLSAAIAKAQFVQVYLEEPTLILPEDENADQPGSGQVPNGNGSVVNAGEKEAEDPLKSSAVLEDDPFAPSSQTNTSAQFHNPAEQLADPSSFDEILGTPLESPDDAPLPPQPKDTSTKSTATGAPASDAAKPEIAPNPPVQSTPEIKRPPLEQSAYSFILGQEGGGDDMRSSLGKSPLQARTRAKVSLFGDESSPAKSAAASDLLESNDEFDLGSLRRAKGTPR